jgi:hypothetical protein
VNPGGLSLIRIGVALPRRSLLPALVCLGALSPLGLCPGKFAVNPLLEPAGGCLKFLVDRPIDTLHDQGSCAVKSPLDPRLMGSCHASDVFGCLAVQAVCSLVGLAVDPCAKLLFEPGCLLGGFVGEPLLGRGKLPVDLLLKRGCLCRKGFADLREFLGVLLLELAGNLADSFIELGFEPRGLVFKLQPEHASEIVSNSCHPRGELVADTMGNCALQFGLTLLAKACEEAGVGRRGHEHKTHDDHHSCSSPLKPGSHRISSLIVSVSPTPTSFSIGQALPRWPAASPADVAVFWRQRPRLHTTVTTQPDVSAAAPSPLVCAVSWRQQGGVAKPCGGINGMADSRG